MIAERTAGMEAFKRCSERAIVMGDLNGVEASSDAKNPPYFRDPEIPRDVRPGVKVLSHGSLNGESKSRPDFPSSNRESTG
jgi:hypothetical protein